PGHRRGSYGMMSLLRDQVPLLVGAAVRRPLIHLRAGGRAGTRVFEREATVQVDEGIAAVAVDDRPPQIVTGGTQRPLDDARAGRGRSALDDGIETALDALELVVAAARAGERPFQVVAGGRRRPLRDIRTVGQRTRGVQDQAAGPVLHLVGAGQALEELYIFPLDLLFAAVRSITAVLDPMRRLAAAV